METSSHTAPSWQDNLLDVLRARERMWFVAAILLILLGALLALLAPGTLPPTLVVGAAVGLAAVLLATALVVGLDASDLIVRGPRHVAAAGGVVAGNISRSTSDIEALVDLIDAHAADGGRARVALTPASRSAGVPGARANIVAAELAARGDKVLVTDLTRGGTPAVGLSDVITGDRKLADAVRFDDELYLAHLAVGSEPELALEGFAEWAQGLPPDLDVLVAALPPLSEPGVLPAVQGVELVLLLVEVDRTERVDLIASLDAIDAAGVPAELVLVDATTAAVRDSASPTVEVLSTPGSTPRQQDPQGFDLKERDGSGVRTVPAPSGEPAAEPATEPLDDEGVRTVPAPTPPGQASAPGTGHTPQPPVADRDQSDSDRAPGDDAEDDYELDDRPVMEPGGGHVRTMRRRGGSATEDTIAMPPVGRDVESSGESVDEPPSDPQQFAGDESSAPPEARDPARDVSPGPDSFVPAPGPEPESAAPEPAPAPEPESPAVESESPAVESESPAVESESPAVGSESPAVESESPAVESGEPAPAAAPGPASHEPAAEPSPVEGPDRVADRPADQAADDAAEDDEDPIDQVAREQARLSASLQQLADDVWSRGND